MPATSTSLRLRFWNSAITSWLLYTVLIVALQWPLVRHPTTCLPMGPTNSPVVPLFNLWTFWWNADRAEHRFQGYWDAPIFFPIADTFAFSEPQPTSMIVAPVIWFTGSRILAYNIYFWLAWLLNGIFTERLLRLRGASIGLARLGGATMILLPLLQWNRDVVQLVPIWGVIWIWTCFLKLSSRPTVTRGVELGLAAGVTSLMCMHYGLFAAVLSASSGWVLVRGWFGRKTWTAWGMGGMLAAIVAGPMIWYVHSVLAELDFQRPEALVKNLSLHPGDYTAAWGFDLIPWGQMASREHWKTSPGWLKCAAAFLGLGLGLWRRQSRRWVLFLALTAGAAFALSLGKNLAVQNWSLWDQLCRVVPGLAQVRSPYRFANFFQVAIVLLAFELLRIVSLWDRAGRIRIAAWMPTTVWERMRAVSGRVMILALGTLLTFEILPLKIELWHSEPISLGREWVDYVRKETPRGRGILCLPFAKGARLEDFDLTAQWMYLGTWHGVPIVNGYSGFFPTEETELRGEFEEEPPSLDRLIRLHADGIEFVVVSSSQVAESLPKTSNLLQIERVFRDPSGVEVIRLSVPEDQRPQ